MCVPFLAIFFFTLPSSYFILRVCHQFIVNVRVVVASFSYTCMNIVQIQKQIIYDLCMFHWVGVAFVFLISYVVRLTTPPSSGGLFVVPP